MKKTFIIIILLAVFSVAKADIVIDSLNRMIFQPVIEANNQSSNLTGIELQYYNATFNTLEPFRIFQQNNATWMKWVVNPGVLGVRSFAINTKGYIRVGDFSTGNAYSYTTPQMLTIHNQSGVGLHIDQKNANAAINVCVSDTGAYIIKGVAPSWVLNGIQTYRTVYTVNAHGVVETYNTSISLSDGSHKRNIKTVTNALESLKEVNPVSYILTDVAETENATQTRSRTMAPENNDGDLFQPDTVVNADIPSNVKDMINEEVYRPKYGFIAQELEKIFPNVVYTMSTGEKGIAYQELIPILVSAIQELQAEVESLKEETPNAQRQQAPAAMQEAIAEGEAALMQNTPNPFNQATEIGYRLPEGTATAMIMLCDMNGKMLQTYPLAVGDTAGTLTIQAGSYAPGMYLYTLLIDGVQIDTKQMIILAH